MSLDIVSALMHFSGMMLLVASFAMMASPQLAPCIRFYGAHSFLLAVLTVLAACVSREWHLLISAILTVGLKTVLIPAIFSQMIRRIGIRREVESYVNIPFSLLLSVLLVFLSFYVAGNLDVLKTAFTREFVPIAISTMMLGMLMMTTRKKAVTQVLGLLLIENGIFLMGMTMTSGMPLLVELGIFFDVLVAVMIMGIFVYKIRSAFEGIDVDELTVLKD